MIFGGWSLLTQLASVLNDILTFTLQYSYIFLLWISLIGWESIDLLDYGHIVPPVLLVVAFTTPFIDTLIIGLSYLTLFSSITQPHAFILYLP